MGIVKRVAARLERQSHLMSVMMERLGVHPELAGQEQFGLSLARAVRTCLFCRRSDACEAWLSHCDGLPKAGPEFCGNRRFFGAHNLGMPQNKRDQRSDPLDSRPGTAAPLARNGTRDGG